MIAHILRKDLKVLWPMVLIATLAHVASAAVSIVLGPFMEPAELKVLGYIFPYASLFALVALVGLVVHQEALLGTEQDWLIRPIRRRDLLLEKLLFVLLLGHGPMLLADMLECLGLGMSLETSLSAAVSNGLVKFLVLTAPSLCLAVVTRNLTEMLVSGICLVLACGLGMLLASMVMVEPPAISSGGLAWMRELFLALAFGILAALILPLQYFRRRTDAARGLVIAGVLIFALTWMFLPWGPSYALQQKLEHPQQAAQIVIHAFEGDSTVDMRTSRSADPAVPRPPSLRSGIPEIDVDLPLRISGVPEGSILLLDRANIRMLDALGNTLYQGATKLFSARGARIEGAGRTPSGEMLAVQSLNIPRSVYLRFKGQSVRLEIDYDITEMGQEPEVHLNADGGTMPNWSGRACVSRYDTDDGDVDLRCLTASKLPSCATLVMENDQIGARNPPFSQCRADYALYPFRGSPLSPFLVKRFGADIPTLEQNDAKALPVGPTDVDHAIVRITTYGIRSHLSSRLIVQDFHLGS